MSDIVTRIKLKEIDWVKWIGWIIVLVLVVSIFAYLIAVRKQMWFAVTNQKAVTACIEGYEGELSEAEKRFEAKQRGTLVSPLVDEAKKE